MDTILLIGGGELKKLRSHLLKRGFQVRSAEPQELEALSEEGAGRLVLGLVDGTAGRGIQELVGRVRASPACRELPLIALVEERHLREVGVVRGVEDFVVTPSPPEMVELRIRFVLNRLNHLAPGSEIRIGALTLNPDRYEVALEGEPLELTYKEFELFKFLATHPGRVYSRDQLLNQVWGYNFIGGTRTVDVHVRRLRAKLGPKYATLIETVRNVGYKFLESL